GGGGRADAADPVGGLQRDRVRGAVRVLPARAELVEPDDPGGLAVRDDFVGGEGGAEGESPDDLRGPAVRNPVWVQLAGEHFEAGREGRASRGLHPPARADSGFSRHLGTKSEFLSIVPSRPAPRGRGPAHQYGLYLRADRR